MKWKPDETRQTWSNLLPTAWHPLPGLWPQGDPKRSKLCRQRATRCNTCKPQTFKIWELRFDIFRHGSAVRYAFTRQVMSTRLQSKLQSIQAAHGCTFSAHQTVSEFLFVKFSLVFNRNSSDILCCLVQEPRVHTWRCRKEACKVHNHHLIQKCLTGPRDTANSASEDTWDRLSMHPLKAILRE